MRKHTSRAVILSSAFLTAGAWARQDPPPAAPPADDQEILVPVRLEPVVVTARKWTELAQDVPLSISVIGETAIREAGITSIREASYLVPNLHMTEFSSRRLSFPTIRGISTGVGDPSVTTYIDGVPQLKISSTNITLLDIERLEFLRGPQGTLYGRNSIGGLIKMETRRPSNTPELRFGSTHGNYDLQEYQLAYTGPLAPDELFISLSGLYSERDGYTKNDFTGNRVDERRSTFGRGSILFTPDDRNDFRYTIYAERSRDGGFVLSDLAGLKSDPHHINQDFEGKADRDIVSNSFTWEHSGESVDITSISSYVDWDISEESDFDFSAFDAVRRFTDESQEYFYQELRIASAADSPLQINEQLDLKWLVGGSLFSSDSDASAANEFRAFAPPPTIPGSVSQDEGDFDDLGLAIFGQATLTIDERLDLTAGVRYDYEDKDADITNTFLVGGFPVAMSARDESESFDEVVPEFSVGYHLSDDALLYARAAKGFKAGGFNLSAPAGNESFDTETSWTYEIGAKTSWLDDALIVNAALFYIDWDDLQLSLFDINSGGYIDNAGGATSQGVELEVAARVAEGVELFAGFGYTDAEFDSFVDQFGGDNSGNNLAFVPETTFNAGAQLNGPIGMSAKWFARGEYVNFGTYYLDAGNRESESFGLANFRVGVEWHNVRLEGWIRNAFDVEYVLVAFQPSPFDPTAFVGENGAPQTFGLTVSVQF